MTIHHDIDRVFKDGLANHTHKPPGYVWDNIAQSLNSRRIKRRRNTMYSIAASGALLLSFGAGYLFNLNHNNQQIAQQTEQQVILPQEEVQDNTPIAVPVATDDKNENYDVVKTKKTPTTKSNTKKEDNTVEEATPEKKNPSTPKAKKINSSGTLLPPIFATGSTFGEDNNATPPIFMEEKEAEKEGKLIGMSMRTLENKPLKKELKYEYREVPMYGESYTEVAPKKQYNKWSLAISAAPLVSYRDISNSSMNNNVALFNADNTSSYEQGYTNEQPLVSYSVGTNVSYNMSSRWKVHSGIYFSEIGQTTKGIVLNTSSHFQASPNPDNYAINTSMGNVNINGGTNELLSALSSTPDAVIRPVDASNQESQYSELSADLVQTLDYFEIPLLISYKVVDRKLGINISGGLSANILYNNSTYLRDNGTNYSLNADVLELKSENYNGIIGFGMEYPIVSQLYINLQPTLRYSLSPINNSGTVYPYSFGLYTGLRYNL